MVMRNLAWVCTSLLLALALGACGDDSRGGDDDAGGIRLMDAGPPAPGRDAGRPPMGTDAGRPPPGDTCTLTNDGLQGAGCFPRCSLATAMAVAACDTAACQQTATEADTTPPITVEGTAVGCDTCFIIQANSCVFNACPDEFGAWATCLDGGGACTTEEAALTACAEANTATIQPCVNMRATLCFPAG